MSRGRGVLVGRRSELVALDAYAGSASLVLVRGVPGSGKTALLGEVERRWRERGVTVVRLDCSVDRSPWDQFSAKAVVEAFRNKFHEIGDARLAAAIAAVNRAAVVEAYESPASRSALFVDLVRLFRGLLGGGPAAVLADDLHAAPNPDMAIAAARQAGCTVVVACRDEGVLARSSVLGLVAAKVLDLGPMAEDEIDEVLAGTQARFDRSVAVVVKRALGSLGGNPGAVLRTFEDLVQKGRFSTVEDHLCLRDPEEPVALPAEHHLVRCVIGLGESAMLLLTLVERMDRFTVDDLMTYCTVTGADISACGRVVDGLVTAGALVCDGEGVLSVSCPALATSVRAEAGLTAVESLHRDFAVHLLRDENAVLPQAATVADHIAFAGTALVADPAAARILVREAERVSEVDPEAAVRWYRAALHHSRGRSAEFQRVMSRLLRLLVQNGNYRCLAEVVSAVAEANFDDHLRVELAECAALAAVHVGVPLSDQVASALARDPRCTPAVDFATGWFEDRRPLSGAEFETAFGTLGERWSNEAGRDEAIDVAVDQLDVLTLFRLFAGSTYREPVSGPLALFGHLVRSFVAGDWDDIPSTARQFEVTSPVATRLHSIARLVVAEVCSARGDFGRARNWLARAAVERPFPALLCWVELGIHYRSDDARRAIELGWATYDEIAGQADRANCVGLKSFLVRLSYLESSFGSQESLQATGREARRWYARHGGAGLRGCALAVCSLVERDHAAAVQAVELARAHGNTPELMRALITVGLVSDEPQPWFVEAYGIARRLGESWMRMSVKSTMRDIGISVPINRASRESLTDNELQIISLIKKGLTNRQIAAEIRVSEKTVENNLTRLFAKTGCRSRLGLAKASIEGRVATPSSGRVS
ncbi:AAA family ATPase [Lentzea sp. JNUCC 0626]|uniref:helix-turn-helix transcriptional regulator n=1 Tax=Lentzea sp. JNUCC 0626 TaxID=3367513 RepID=UPI003747F022